VQPISIHVGAPARTGLPIWVFADLQGPLTARYPYGEDPRYLGSNRLELKRDGKTLPPQPGYGGGGPLELVVGSIAPPRAPQNRLPLHLAFAIDKPGRYSVHWTVVGERREAGPPPSRHDELLAQSNWLEFDVKAAKLSEREAWLRKLLAAPPTDDTAYVGDYLPSLLAGVPDARVARAMIDGTYSARELIASCTFGGLRFFPAEVAVPLTLESLHRRGPSRGLGYFSPGMRPGFRTGATRSSARRPRSCDRMTTPSQKPPFRC
jgi:hypothetical protein